MTHYLGFALTQPHDPVVRRFQRTFMRFVIAATVGVVVQQTVVYAAEGPTAPQLQIALALIGLQAMVSVAVIGLAAKARLDWAARLFGLSSLAILSFVAWRAGFGARPHAVSMSFIIVLGVALFVPFRELLAWVAVLILIGYAGFVNHTNVAPLTHPVAQVSAWLLVLLLAAYQVSQFAAATREFVGEVEQHTEARTATEGQLKRERAEKATLEAHVSELQKLDSIGRVAGGLAHDLNNALTAIGGSMELAAMDPGATADIREELAAGAKAVEGARGLTMKLLTFARRQPVAVEALPLADMVRDALPMLQRLLDAGHPLDFEDDDAPLVLADRTQLLQVVLNLVVNARDASPPGAAIRVVTRRGAPELPLEGSSTSRWGALVVRDAGSGMSPEVRQHLFEPFFTTKGRGRGSGLGLATSFGIVRRLGGVIECDSAPGRGTEFRVFLPEAAGGSVAPAAATTISA